MATADPVSRLRSMTFTNAVLATWVSSSPVAPPVRPATASAPPRWRAVVLVADATPLSLAGTEPMTEAVAVGMADLVGLAGEVPVAVALPAVGRPCEK